MVKISPTAAAKQWKASKTTIYKLMNDGQLSFTLNDKGKRVLDTSELVRVLGEPGRSEKTKVDDLQEQMKRQNDELVQVLKAQVASQQEQIKTLTTAMERFSLLLEHQQPIPAKQEPIEPGVKVEESPILESNPKAQQPAKRKRSLFQRVLSAVVED